MVRRRRCYFTHKKGTRKCKTDRNSNNIYDQEDDHKSTASPNCDSLSIDSTIANVVRKKMRIRTKNDKTDRNSNSIHEDDHHKSTESPSCSSPSIDSTIDSVVSVKSKEHAPDKERQHFVDNSAWTNSDAIDDTIEEVLHRTMIDSDMTDGRRCPGISDMIDKLVEDACLPEEEFASISNKRKYRCRICNITCSNKTLLSLHIRCKHQNGSQLGPYRQYTQKSSTNLSPNLQMKQSPQCTFACEMCGLGFRSSMDLNSHHCLQHSDNSVQPLVVESVGSSLKVEPDADDTDSDVIIKMETSCIDTDSPSPIKQEPEELLAEPAIEETSRTTYVPILPKIKGGVVSESLGVSLSSLLLGSNAAISQCSMDSAVERQLNGGSSSSPSAHHQHIKLKRRTGRGLKVTAGSGLLNKDRRVLKEPKKTDDTVMSQIRPLMYSSLTVKQLLARREQLLMQSTSQGQQSSGELTGSPPEQH